MLTEINSKPSTSSIQQLITNKWKVAYDDMSLECKASGDRLTTRRRPLASFPCHELQVLKHKKNDGANLNNNPANGEDIRPTAYGHQQGGDGGGGAPKKSQSVPPPASRALDCLDCPGMVVEESRDQKPCSCPRKRKEPQDSLHEHERKFSRSSSLELEKDDMRSNMLLVLNPDSLMVENDDLQPSPVVGDNHVLKEVQEHVQLKKQSGETELRKKSRRRKRQRKESPQEFKENAIQEVEEQTDLNRNNIDSKEVAKTEAKENKKEESDSKEGKPEGIRKSALSFLFNEPGPIARRSSSPLLGESPASPVSSCRRSVSIGGEKPTEQETGGGCWVSQRLAHIMRVETEKETMSLDSETPRSFHLLDSGRFLEENKHLDSNRSTAEEKEKPRLKQLTKQLSNLRRRIEEVEQQLHVQQGYRPSHQDKLNNSQLKALMAEQNKIKKEIKAEKENAEDKLRRVVTPTTEKCMQRIKARLTEIMEKMEENRRAKNRPVNYQDMSLEQVFEEKLELQSLLREYEKEFGHPESREEKDLMKDVYERYRVIKRMARRSSQVKSGDSSVDLITIPEDEEVDLTLVSPQHRINLQLPNNTSNRIISSSNPLSRHDMDLPSFSSAGVAEGGCVGEEGKLWHAMTRDELLAILKTVREDKKIARRAVKEFEDRFRNMTGRRVTKEDREPLEKTYKVYKTSKSKVKLINALLSKPRCGARIER